MIIFIISLFLSASLFSYEEYCEWLGTYIADVKEHYASVFHRSSLLIVGYTYPYGWIELPFFIIGYWILTDGLMNLLKGRPFFHISESSGNPIEKFSTWYVKLILFVLSIILILKGA